MMRSQIWNSFCSFERNYVLKGQFPLRKLVIYTILVVCFFLFAVNISIFVYDNSVVESVLNMDSGGSSMTERSVDSVSDMNKTLPVLNPTGTIRESFKSAESSKLGRMSEQSWFGGRGRVAPLVGNSSAFWPEQDAGDRIVNQLMYSPPLNSSTLQPLKTILLYHGFVARFRQGRDEFLSSRCPVNTCYLTTNVQQITRADAVLFRSSPNGLDRHANSEQIWIMHTLESPKHAPSFVTPRGFNWTATYRHDSDLVTPYEKWVYYNDSVRSIDQSVNYAANKTKKVAWFVSNCGANNGRLEYARKLAKYIEVDIYGSCGTKSCPRFFENSCFKRLKQDYKFYLAFENSNCRDYITEKLFVNGLGNDLLPIVMGAHPDDYSRVAPEHSYIHVDEFSSPHTLAQYLHKLDQDDELYNSYFRWKGTGRMINTFFFCRLCAALHVQPSSRRVISDIYQWWNGPGVCTADRWLSNSL